MKRHLVGAMAAALLASSAPASTIIAVTLTNGQENPPVNPSFANGDARTSVGSGTIEIDDAMTALIYTFTVTGIDLTGSQSADTNDNLTAAHIHAGAAVSPVTNGPVVFGFRGGPFNDNAPNDVVTTPFATGVGGTISGKWDASEGNGTTRAAQLPNILAGRAYVNFHTVQFGGGELRGNIPATAAVPEPAAWLTMVAGFGLVGVAVRRRRWGTMRI